MTVFWTNNAKRELRAVSDYIAQNSPRYAQGLVDWITRKPEQLAQLPQRTGPRREDCPPQF